MSFNPADSTYKQARRVYLYSIQREREAHTHMLIGDDKLHKRGESVVSSSKVTLDPLRHFMPHRCIRDRLWIYSVVVIKNAES